ncbi:MAG: benzil reductase ((S)-benzoin forming) [Sulfurimonas sp.]|jgi:benzil reductase ((S)-benzoin forming)|uniref:SDR family NAD(P)-dependent oxidoreductase n=1 Tax=Sulfurimonas sp. TaxID=2022749 RepID=UPI0039E61ECD
MKSNLFIITGTTQGLGNALFKKLQKNNMIITLNRKEIIYPDHNINLCIDLSNINFTKISEFEKLLDTALIQNIKKIVFINNAFTMGTLARIDNLETKEILNSFNTNLISSFLLLKSFINKTKELPIDKRILNISSGAANKAIDGWSVYCISKSSMEMLLETIKLEYNDFKCLNVDPGVMDTQMQSKIRNFKDSSYQKYFLKLFKNKELKDTYEVAENIIRRHLQ